MREKMQRKLLMNCAQILEARERRLGELQTDDAAAPPPSPLTPSQKPWWSLAFRSLSFEEVEQREVSEVGRRRASTFERSLPIVASSTPRPTEARARFCHNSSSWVWPLSPKRCSEIEASSQRDFYSFASFFRTKNVSPKSVAYAGFSTAVAKTKPSG